MTGTVEAAQQQAVSEALHNLEQVALVAEAAVELGDIRRAKQYLKRTIDVGPNPEEMSQLKYVEGRVLELSADFLVILLAKIFLSCSWV